MIIEQTVQLTAKYVIFTCLVGKQLIPAPGAYAPEKHYYPPSPSAPAFSMGKRLKGRRHDGLYNPGPNAYRLPSHIGAAHPDLKRAPAYFLTFRDKRGKNAIVLLCETY